MAGRNWSISFKGFHTIPDCALQPYHQNGFAHASDGSGKLFLDYCFFSCTKKRLEMPELMIRAGWIRPEDIHYYKEIGIDSIKLLERNMPSEDLLHRVKAYATEKSPDNLATLLFSHCFSQPVKRSRGWLFRYFIRPLAANPLRLLQIGKIAKRQGLTALSWSD